MDIALQNAIAADDATLKAHLVAAIKTEILADIASGVVPAGVESFGELHDHVDANEYGGFCDDEINDALQTHFGDGLIDFINDVQTEVDEWLSAGRP